ncbi:hypothetical protein ATG_05820 [Desulfurococcaceae archaeon AG1]|nr:hypothetical protein ATG_05820 [Desulfurococcaceae archaeon AG1]
MIRDQKEIRGEKDPEESSQKIPGYPRSKTFEANKHCGHQKHRSKTGSSLISWIRNKIVEQN